MHFSLLHICSHSYILSVSMLRKLLMIKVCHCFTELVIKNTSLVNFLYNILTLHVTSLCRAKLECGEGFIEKVEVAEGEDRGAC